MHLTVPANARPRTQVTVPVMSGPRAHRVSLGPGAAAFYCERDPCMETGVEIGSPVMMKDHIWCVHCYGCGELIIEPSKWCALHETEACPEGPVWWLTGFPAVVVREAHLLGAPWPIPHNALRILGAIVESSPELWWEPQDLVGRWMLTVQAWGRLRD